MRVLTAALLMVLVFPAWAQQGTETVEPLTITVGANHAPPYRILQGGERTGLYVEIFEEIAERLGWEVHYREAPFRRVLRMVQQGEVDVMLGPLETEERSELIEFVAPAFPPERRLFFYLNKEHRMSATPICTAGPLACSKARRIFRGLMMMRPCSKSRRPDMKT